MSKDYQESSIKAIPFNGKKENFLIWIEKFKTKALQKARLDTLTNVEKIPKKTEYEDAKNKTGSNRTADIEGIIEQYQCAMAVYSDLILSMDTAKKPGKVVFKIVKQAKTADNQDGNPYLALENLTNKYEAKTALNFIKLEGQFTNSKLSKDEDDPDEWITHLEALRTRMNEVQIVGKSMKSDTDLILHILANVPEAYEMQVN
jgi:hypothetical protein